MITTAEFLPKEQGLELHSGLPSLGVLQREHLALMPARLTWGEPEAVENTDCTLKRCPQDLTCPGTQGRAVICKEPRSDLPADLEESFGEAGGNWSSPGEQGY